jgi:hypothetical protein
MESNGSLLWSQDPDPGEAVHTPHPISLTFLLISQHYKVSILKALLDNP